MEWYYQFDWKSAPLSSVYWPVGAAILYLGVVATMLPRAKRLKKERQQQQQSTGTNSSSSSSTVWNIGLAAHNAILCIWSLVMLLGGVYEVYRRATGQLSQSYVVPRPAGFADNEGLSRPASGILGAFDHISSFLWSESSLKWFICESPNQSSIGPLYFWSYIYYLSKYYELFDTIIALAKGTVPPSLKLHVYHHAVVLTMAWLWLEQSQTLQFGGLLFNTLVHVFMYYYYAKRALGQRVWWKNYITMLQIVQFGTSFLLLMFTVREWSTADMQQGEVCAGTTGLLFNAVFNLTLLQSFVGVLTRNSKPSQRKKVKQT